MTTTDRIARMTEGARLIFGAAVALGFAHVVPGVATAESLRVQASHGLAKSTIEIAIGERSFEIAHIDARRYDLAISGDATLDLSSLATPPAAAAVVSARAVESAEGARARFVLSCDCPPRAK